MSSNYPEISEPAPIADIYSDGIADVELLGGQNVRLIFYTMERGERVVVGKVVMPRSACTGQVPDMITAKMRAVMQPVISASRN